jgi:hypothetical protein
MGPRRFKAGKSVRNVAAFHHCRKENTYVSALLLRSWGVVLSFSVVKRVRPLIVAAVASGCAPALSSFTPAHVAPKKHVQAELGMDVSIPTGTLVRAIDASDAIVSAAKQRPLTEAEKQSLTHAAIALLLNPPSVTPHLGVGYTVADRFEINGRYSVGTLRLGFRYQLMERAKGDRFDMTTGLGIGRYTYEFPVSDQLEVIVIDDFQRWQLDVPFQIGGHDDYHRWWMGPRLMATKFDTAIRAVGPPLAPFLVTYDGYSMLAGAQFGVAVGYKKIFFGIELTLAELWLRSKVKAAAGTSFAEKKLDLESFIIYPGFGLLGEF